jgi:hypothetical protein
MIRAFLTRFSRTTGWLGTWARGRAASSSHAAPTMMIDRVEAAAAVHDWLLLLAIMDRCASAIWHAGADDDFFQFQRAADRMNLIAQQLISAPPMEIGRPQLLDLNQVIAESHGLLTRAVAQDISLRLELGGIRHSRITATRWDLERMLLHLVLNASRQIDTPGVVLLQTSYVQQVPSGLRPSQIRARPYLRLVVSGSGSRSARPTRTIRSVSSSNRQGDALRLATVARLVKQLNGVLQFETDAAALSRVRVDFPLVSD